MSKGTALRLILAAATAIVIPGCLVNAPSVYPLYTKDSAIIEPGIEGTWVREDDSFGATRPFHTEKLIFRRSGKGAAYLGTYIEEETRARFSVHFVRLGGAVFMDTYLLSVQSGDSGKNGASDAEIIASFYSAPAHRFERVKLQGNILQFRAMSGDWLENGLADGSLTLAHVSADEQGADASHTTSDGNTIVIIAPTKELQDFVAKYHEDAFPASGMEEWHRKGNSAPRVAPSRRGNPHQ